jgi:putative FmdB family regulatory protein
MPFYEYQCKNCGHELEAMQKVSDSALKKCPHCGKSQLQRLMSAPVFRLKGGGWYETDFKDDKDKKRNLADKPESEVSKETETKATDAKAETKVDAKKDASAADTAGTKEKASEKSSAESGGKSESKKIDLKRGKRTTKKPVAKPKKKAR